LANCASKYLHLKYNTFTCYKVAYVPYLYFKLELSGLQQRNSNQNGVKYTNSANLNLEQAEMLD